MKDIETREDVAFLIETFYATVVKDPTIGAFFARVNFEKHMPRMIHFWTFALLDEPGYTTDVTKVHINMRLEPHHFERWLTIFNETVDSHFTGEKAEAAKQRAYLVGWTIQSKIGANKKG